MAVNFYIDKRTDKSGNSPIRISVNIKGVRLLTTTNQKIHSSKWDTKRQQVKKGCSNSLGITYNSINATLSRIAEHYKSLENDVIVSGKKVTPEYLKNDFKVHFRRTNKSTLTKSSTNDIEVYIYEFIREQSKLNQWAEGTSRVFLILINLFKSYKKDFQIEDLNDKTLPDFFEFLVSKGIKNTYIKALFCRIRWFQNWAKSKRYIDCGMSVPKLKTTTHKVVFLDWNELMLMNNLEIPNTGEFVELTDYEGSQYKRAITDKERLELTKDIFCFCCFTSLRYSDAISLLKSNIIDGKITITTVKTSDTITIELNKYALQIINKYKFRTDKYLFPYITKTRMNIDLKLLGELCGINQPITDTFYKGNERIDETFPKYQKLSTHTGRRTFICNALMLGIPAEIVMKWTGHSDYKSMKPYIDISNSAKEKAMNLFNNI